MQEVYHSPYQTFLFFVKDALLVQIWHSASDNMTDEIYQQDFLLAIKALHPYLEKTSKLLIDARKFKYPVSPELQIWHQQHIAQRFTILIKKSAIVSSESPLIQLAIEQTLEDGAKASPDSIQLFDCFALASQWLTGKLIDCRVTPYQAICYQQVNETLTQVWNTNSENIVPEKLFVEFQDFADLATAHHPFKLLIHAQLLQFPILPKVQHWLNEEVLPNLLINRLKYIALVISENAHVQLSLDQTLEDIKTYPVEVESFETLKDAEWWLNP